MPALWENHLEMALTIAKRKGNAEDYEAMMAWARRKQAHVYKGVYGSAATYDELLDAMNQELFAELREDYAQLAFQKFFAAKADVAQGFLLARILFLERRCPDEAGCRSLRVHTRFLGARRMSSETADSLYGALRDFLVAVGVDPQDWVLWGRRSEPSQWCRPPVQRGRREQCL